MQYYEYKSDEKVENTDKINTLQNLDTNMFIIKKQIREIIFLKLILNLRN